MIKDFERQPDGSQIPKYTDEQAQRIAKACWGVQHLLPHADDVANEDAAAVREFHRALVNVPPLPDRSAEPKALPRKRIYCWRVGAGCWAKNAEGDCPECGVHGRSHREISSSVCGSQVVCRDGSHGHHCELPPDHGNRSSCQAPKTIAACCGDPEPQSTR